VGSVAEAQAAVAAGVDAVIAQGIEAGGRATTTGPAARRGIPIGSFRGPAGELVPWPRYAVGVATADFDGDIEYAPLWAGQSCSVVNDLKPAATIVRDLVRDAEAAMAGS
jgi:NAD(P)H-dependent flavin oxidoreductase YrpB (nitropropane dioxygenase family)